MAVIAQQFAKVSGFAVLVSLLGNMVANMDKNTVPHWVDFLNEK